MIAVAVNLLHFQTRKEGFHRSVVIWDTRSGKGLRYTVVMQQVSKLTTCVLPSLVAVKQQTALAAVSSADYSKISE